MGYQIEIKEGHDTSSYFWFRPAIVNNLEKITYEDVELLGEEISIEEGYIECFLAYFLYKYFDEELFINKHRYEYGVEDGYIQRFEWYLTHNFYTYECMYKMLKDIEETTELLEKDYNNEKLTKLKERFSIFYLCESNHLDYIARDNRSIEKHKGVIINFYTRFVERMRKMMENNPETNVISIMGP